MKKDSSLFLLCMLLMIFNLSFSQDNSRKYYFLDYHTGNDVGLKHESIKIIGNSGIDPHDTGVVDYAILERNLKKAFPKETDGGILCIDLENSIYQNLRNNDKESIKAKKSIEEFVTMLVFIKKKRPNIKVGVYALPFPFYYSNQIKRNESGKLDEIVKNVDIIFPSLYMYYPAAQKGLKSNLAFLKENLEAACSLAKKYNKEVIPLVWYLVHPSNKKYKHAMLEKSEMKSYIDFIWNFSESEFKLKGIWIWNSPTPFTKKSAQTSLLKSRMNYNNTSEAIEYYKSAF